jgi:hypothetical protein
MKTTKNYDKFNLLDFNREMSESHIKKIKESIDKYGYVMSNPIIVDKEYNVIDGQHRFIACKELDLPIVYEVEEKGTDLIITLNTTQRRWQLSDYINYYANKYGNANYLRLKKLSERHHLQPNTILILLHGTSGENVAKQVKKGNLKFTAEEELTVNSNLNACKQVAENLKIKLSVRFIESLLQLSRMSNFKWLTMINKSLKYPTLAYNCITRDDYLTMLRYIYNYQARSSASKI